VILPAVPKTVQNRIRIIY